MNSNQFYKLNDLRHLLIWNDLPDSDALKNEYKAFYGLPSETIFHYNSGYINADDFWIYVQIWRPAVIKKTVFIIHGYFDHSGLYSHIIRFFLKQSCAVFIFDLPGHGLSTGERTGIKNFSLYSSVLNHCLAWAKDKLPAPWCLFGQSTGAAIIINSVLIDAINFEYSEINHIILFAPLIKITHWKYSKFMCTLLSPFTKTVKRKKSKNSRNPAFIALLEKDPLQSERIALSWVRALYQWVDKIHQANHITNIPTLIVQGECDKTVDWSYNVNFLSATFSFSELFLLPQASHHLVNESKFVRDEYYAKLATWLQAR